MAKDESQIIKGVAILLILILAETEQKQKVIL